MPRLLHSFVQGRLFSRLSPIFLSPSVESISERDATYDSCHCHLLSQTGAQSLPLSQELAPG
ncbi:hypothetical protein E2C01_065477 [Portunus trituberculatus]|uniref:Uncharacterized protein n=1 Tax=Portunus trituberculatus TaxID=210409 RepID=A0A5B7HNH4_PORTR|nr:hypothetical protein [Portunus trituberculatus]